MRTVGATLTAVVVGVAVIGAVIFGGWELGWWFRAHNVDRSYQVNTHSQGYQQAQIDHLHDLFLGWTATTDPAQRANVSLAFCEGYADLTHPTGSIVAEAAQLGC